jgi:hypothetical protein
MKQHKVRFYFDQQGVITSRLGIENAPAIVTQKGNKLLIKELLIQKKESD